MSNRVDIPGSTLPGGTRTTGTPVNARSRVEVTVVLRRRAPLRTHGAATTHHVATRENFARPIT